MDPSSLRSLSSILAKNKPAAKDALTAVATRLAEEPLATVYTKSKAPPSGYTIDEEEEAPPRAYTPTIPPPPVPVKDLDLEEEEEETFSAPALIPRTASSMERSCGSPTVRPRGPPWSRTSHWELSRLVRSASSRSMATPRLANPLPSNNLDPIRPRIPQPSRSATRAKRTLRKAT